jgi:hypothetical protein
MLNEQDYFDRRLYVAVAELNDLERRRFTTIKLTEPIQRGWRRIFVLTAHAECRKDRDTLLAILEIIARNSAAAGPTSEPGSRVSGGSSRSSNL